MAIWEFNRGEWTEAYVFIKLLADGRIYGADSNFNKNENLFLDILRILRYESAGILEFKRQTGTNPAEITASCNSTTFKVITAPELSQKASYLYDAIKNITDKKRKLSISEIETFLSSLKFSSPKAPVMPKEWQDKYGKKTDIIITTLSSTDRAEATEGFSIKSHLGSSPTLFNSSEGSRFVYKVVGCSEQDMHRINAIDYAKQMVQAIKDDNHLSLEFVQTYGDICDSNLALIDSQMTNIMQVALLLQIGYLGDDVKSDVPAIADALAEFNPLKVRHPEFFYPTKMKDFLFASFAGMTAAEKWDGRKRLTGGYIDVSPNGDVLYYRAMSDDVFSSYLYENTYFDRPDRGVLKDLACLHGRAYLEGRTPSKEEIYEVEFKNNKKRPKKGNWGYIYEENGEYFFDLNFQIRFK